MGIEIESENYRKRWQQMRTDYNERKEFVKKLFAILRRTNGFQSIYSTRRK